MDMPREPRIIAAGVRRTDDPGLGVIPWRLSDVVYRFVEDLGWGRLPAVSDLSRDLVGRAVDDGRRRALPGVWSLALAGPSHTSGEDRRTPPPGGDGPPPGLDRRQG